ncbi:MAG: exonuclease subunit alpha [Gemmataceae bacterium]|nr:exonuclease subunit alpha [Gemmataceae bacterium]
MSPPAPIPISVNDLGEYIRHQSCDRRFYLKTHADEVKRLPFFERMLNSVEPVLQKVGREREDQWEQELVDHGFRDFAATLTKGEHRDVGWAEPALSRQDIFRNTI